MANPSEFLTNGQGAPATGNYLPCWCHAKPRRNPDAQPATRDLASTGHYRDHRFQSPEAVTHSRGKAIRTEMPAPQPSASRPRKTDMMSRFSAPPDMKLGRCGRTADRDRCSAFLSFDLMRQYDQWRRRDSPATQGSERGPPPTLTPRDHAGCFQAFPHQAPDVENRPGRLKKFVRVSPRSGCARNDVQFNGKLQNILAPGLARPNRGQHQK